MTQPKKDNTVKFNKDVQADSEKQVVATAAPSLSIEVAKPRTTVELVNGTVIQYN